MKDSQMTLNNFYNFLEDIVLKGASDFHLIYNATPTIRINGMLQALSHAPTYTVLKNIALELLNEEEKHLLYNHQEVDISFEIPNVSRFRANYYYTQGHISLAFRFIKLTPPTLEDIAAPALFYNIIQRQKGLILFCGATGSGKSSSIAAMLHHINQTQNKHIITIEDPTEFIHINQKSYFSHRCVFKDTKSYQSGLKSALREDPDIISIGEIRDNEICSLALNAAQSGHLVFSTMHASSAVAAITRMVGSYKGEEQPQIRSQLAETLLMIVVQTLIPSTQGGRIAAYEILCNDPAIANLIREGKFYHIDNHISLSSATGMQLLNHALKKLIHSKTITLQNALQVSYNPADLQTMLNYP